jgi:hypothetical protein
LKTFSRKAGGEMGWGRLSEKTKNSNFIHNLHLKFKTLDIKSRVF